MNGRKEGIDTLKFKIEDFEYSENELKNNCWSGGRNVFFTKENLPYTKYYRNNEFWSGTIMNDTLTIEMSLPKYLKGENDNKLLSVFDTQTYNYFKGVLEKELKENGIYTDIEKGKISRIDITTMNDMDNLSVFYIEMLKLSNLKYCKPTNKRVYNTSISYGNTSKELSIYDKLNEEMGGKFISNNLRVELKVYNKSNNIYKLYGIRDIKDLKDNMDIYQKRKQYLKDNFFTNENIIKLKNVKYDNYNTINNKIEILIKNNNENGKYQKKDNLVPLLWLCFSQTTNNNVNDFLEYYKDNREYLKSLIKETNTTRLDKLLDKQLQQFLINVDLIKDHKDPKRSYISLYNELYDKLIS